MWYYNVLRKLLVNGALIIFFVNPLLAQPSPLTPEGVIDFNPLEYVPQNIQINENLILPADRPLGNLKAPVTIIEYASFSCPHCWLFNSTIFPEIQSKYIDTGKVLFIIRDFPFDGAALKASTLVECYYNGKHRESNNTEVERNYLQLYKAFFQVLNKHTTAPHIIEDLQEIALNNGMSKAEFNSCVEDKKISEQIIKAKLFAIQRLHITVAPTFYINGKEYKGAPSKEFFLNEIEKALNLAK